MKEYKKPLIDVVREAAEGVYATSGGSGVIKCDSDYMNYNMEWPTYGWEYGVVGVREAYGCLGCPAYTYPNGECGLKTHWEDADFAESYGANAGNYMPAWESRGYEENDTFTYEESWKFGNQ